MLYWIYDVPIWVTFLLVVGSFVGFSVAGSIILRPVLRRYLRHQADLNSVIGDVLSFFGVIFGILIGMLAVVTYQNQSTAQQVAANEAASLAALYVDVSFYPEPSRSALQGVLRDYTRYVIDEAWPLQRQGIIPTDGTRRVLALAGKFREFEPQTKGQEIQHTEAMRQFNTFVTNRRLRLNSVESSIPNIMWYTVLIGCMLSVALVWLFEMRYLTEILVGAMLSAALGTVICLIALMDNPFRGRLGVSADSYELVYQQLMRPGP
jgi:hypothetical protein